MSGLFVFHKLNATVVDKIKCDKLMTYKSNGLQGLHISRICSFYPAVRMGSSNTLFIPWFFFGGHLPQTSGFRSAKEILVVSFATQPRAVILSDRNIFYTPRGGEQRRGLMPLGLFLSVDLMSGLIFYNYNLLSFLLLSNPHPLWYISNFNT